MSARKPIKRQLLSGPGRRAALDLKNLRSFCVTQWGQDVHAKRVESVANGAAGALHSAVLAVHAIGAGYAALSSGQTKHGIKHVARLLGNPGFEVWDSRGPGSASC